MQIADQWLQPGGMADRDFRGRYNLLYSSGEHFDVSIDPPPTPANYVGSFTRLAGADPVAFGELATQDFQVQVVSPSAEPEPGTLALMGIGIMGLFASIRRKKLV